MSGFKGFVHENGLTLAFGTGFLLTLVGQSIAGHAELNSVLTAQSLQPLSFPGYLFTSDFMVDVTENWQSEFLQFFLYIVGTVWLLQRGSPESKPLDKAGTETDREQKVGVWATSDSPKSASAPGLRRGLYSHSLGIVMFLIFILSWLAQSVTGRIAFNEEQLRELQDPVGWLTYVTSAEFWNRTLQNWQSELLAVASMAILAVYLRQRGSPESKPVGAAHTSTGIEG
ncbi:hypothetical protein OHA84_01720 [Streptomyces sp. NBC_00513]|uniref:DUF6766 family protein n=1 Tax=unclassified Streptomyces TaxID=2593676 RepID=UPI00224F4C4B|nr:DUF6766 family protein [Streptomyces sp. NBC_00424]MCX5079118.1 hypothetical protein [Streptomyces sp. NBC_00424]WUD39317.1 hypothetical protein OHA84_01720 [Streptomyces sp. NBC_00513]